MTMKHENDRASQQDRELSRRFTQMRQADAEQVPDFPSEEELAQRSPIPAVNPLYSRVRKVAVAAAIVVAVSILMTRPAPQDPGALYADIMSANAMATDQLMLVSQGASPEMSSMPGIFEIDLPEYTN
jgi:negative regulator of sigma E activity